MMRALGKLTAPISRRLRLVVSRAVIGMVNDSLKTQRLQLTLLDGEVQDGVERFAEYGFTSVPHAGAQAVMVCIGGSRSHGIVIATQDGRYRLTGMAEGEVALYDDLGHKVHLTRNGIVIDGAGQQITLTNTPKVRMESDLDVIGQVKDLCDSADGRTMAQMRTTYSGHTHNETGSVTNAPNQAV